MLLFGVESTPIKTGVVLLVLYVVDLSVLELCVQLELAVILELSLSWFPVRELFVLQVSVLELSALGLLVVIF